MKQIVLIILAAILAIPAVSLAGIINPARIQLIEGDVMFRSPDAEDWLPAAVNTPLDEGDAIWTSSTSRAEVQLADGSIVRLDSGSNLDFIAVEEGFTHLHLASGRIYLRTARNMAKSSLQIDADNTSVVPEARTRLRIDMLANNQEDVSIFKGSAYVEGNGNRTKVRAGEHIALEEGHSELLLLNPPDNWEKWNSDRDKNQARTTAVESNLPDELQPFSDELDSNGKWVRIAEYGMVWRPTVILSEEWAPYRSGRWIWKGDDYVWISYESWGWVPYHYGRWAVVSGFGWCWIPPERGDIYWGPGYVGWYRSVSHIGWTPLAPGEIFYGHRQFGRHSINIANASVSPATVVYRNRDARDGFSVLHQNDFLKGRSVFQKPSEIITTSLSASIGSPRIQPVVETRMPIIKQIPQKFAPQAIQHYTNNELRARYPRLTPEIKKQRNDQSAVVTTAPTPSLTPVISRRNNNSISHSLPTQPTRYNPVHRTPSEPSGLADKQKHGINGVQGGGKKEIKQKKVWSVTTTEQGSEKDQKDKEPKEHKGRK